AAGDLGEVGGEVVAAHDRGQVGERGRVDRVADQGGRQLGVDDRLVAELVVEVVVRAVRGRHAADDLLDQHGHPFAQVGVERAHGAGHLDTAGQHVRRVARVEGADAQHGALERVDAPGD